MTSTCGTLTSSSSVCGGGTGSRRTSGAVVRGNRMRNSLPRAVPGARCGQRTGVEIDQPARERQPDTKAAVFPGWRGIAAPEQIEDARQPLLGDADAAVAHANVNHPVNMIGDDVDLAAGFGELGGVVHDVGQRLLRAGHDRR